ncbi:MAG: hypothetical protein K2G03_00310 [Bacilli bacterium]|nr:hypothetical protein [Bacilli bacterium]
MKKEVNSVKKWDNTISSWRDIESPKEKGIALSTVTYGKIRNNESNGRHYVLIADGCKVNDFSLRGETLELATNGAINVLNYFRNKNENYVVEAVFMDLHAPHIEETKWLASYINELAKNPYVKTISFLGHSKCGVMAFHLLRYLTPLSISKSYIYSVSSPYTGALLATPCFLRQEFQRVVESKLGKCLLADMVVESLMGIYNMKFSNSQLDFDISIPGGLPDDVMERYDPSFIGNVFSKENVSLVEKGVHWQNICTAVDNNTLREVMKANDILGLGFCILNEFLFEGKSDGLVSLASQKAVEKQFMDDHSQSKIIYSTHFVYKIPKFTNELLDVVDDNIKRLSYK